MEDVLKSIRNQVEKYVDFSAVAKFISQHKIAVAATASVCLYGAYFMKRPKNLPPGPLGFPFIGCMPYLSKDFKACLDKLRAKHGDIFTLWLGRDNYVVVLCGYALIKKVFLERGKEFAGRQSTKVAEVMCLQQNMFNLPYDEMCKSGRKAMAQGMRTVISSQLDAFYAREMELVYDYVKEHGGEIELFDINSELFVRGSLQMFINKSFSRDSKEFTELLEEFKAWFKLFMQLIALDYMPGFAGILMHSQKKAAKLSTKKLLGQIESWMEESRSSTGEEITCLVDALTNEKSGMTKSVVLENMLVFMPDTVQSTPIISVWVCYFLLKYPDYQEQIYQEIKAVHGNDLPSINEKSNMPLLESFILEVFRMTLSIMPGLLSIAEKDTTIEGYNIPKFVKVQPFLGSVLSDPDPYPDPDTFKPERFIVDGKVMKTDAFVPFGIGRRTCLGQQLVTSHIFMFWANMIPTYKMTAGEGGLPKVDVIKLDDSGMLDMPKFKLKLVEREPRK